MAITKEDFESYLKVEELIKDIGSSVAHMNGVRESFEKVTDISSTMIFGYTNTDRCGDSQSIAFPIEYLFCDNWKEKEQEKLDKIAKLKQERDNSIEADRERALNEKDRADYERLKKKFSEEFGE